MRGQKKPFPLPLDISYKYLRKNINIVLNNLFHNLIIIMSADITLQNPCNIILAGPSGSGKTHKILNILRQRKFIFSDNPQHVILFYSVWQKIYDVMLNELLVDEFIEEMPDDKQIKNLLTKHKSSCLIFDDLAQNINSSIEKLFTVNSHHYNCTIFLLTQNLFSKNKVWRTISLNCHYFLLTRNPRDPSQISHLSSQIFPRKKNFLGNICKYYS